MSFPLCLNAITIKPVPLLEKIRFAAAAGFEAFEPWTAEIDEYLGAGGELRDIEKALADAGLTVPCAVSLRGWGDAEGAEYSAALDECRRQMAMAARLGAHCIVATPPREACDLGRLADRYGELLELGRGQGVKPSLEYISFFGSLSRLDQAWEIVRGLGDEDASVLVDGFHTWNSSPTPLEDLRLVDGDRIAHYHFDDASPHKPLLEQMDADRVMPGDGVIDLDAEVAVLREIGYQGTVSLELFNAELWADDPQRVLGVGIERMCRYFGRSRRM